MPQLGPRAGRRARCAALTLTLSALACGGTRARSTEDARFAALSPSREAQSEFRPLARSFASASGRQRVAMEGALSAFRARFPRDPLVRHADALLAWVALERGDTAAAARAARAARERGGGTVGDLAAVVEGAAARRRGDTERALRLLRPLSGKILDGHVQELLDDELVAAAVATKRWDDAVRLIRASLREDGEAKLSENARIVRRLDAIPPEVLFRAIEGRFSALRPDDDMPDARRLRRLVAAKLAGVARESRDPAVGQRVFDAAATFLTPAEGEEVAELASDATNARFEPRTVGLLLATADPEARRRAVATAMGLAIGLDLPRSKVRLVARDDGNGERTYEGLLSLAADGAGVIVAGTTTEASDTAAQFAQSNRIAVLLLRPPRTPSDSELVFEVGERFAGAAAALRRVMEEQGAPDGAVWVDDLDADGSDVHALPCGNMAPVATKGRVILGGEGCRSISELAHLPLGLGPEARALRRPGATLLIAGEFGIDAGATLRAAWGTDRAGEPSWWMGLGHDAGVLAGAAIRAAGGEATDELPEVLARRAAVAKALMTATGGLWTTDASGFGSDRRLPRALRAALVK